MGACHLRGSAGSYGAGSGVRQNARTMLTNGRRTLPVELSVQISKSAEQKRLDEAREQEVPWKQWGPYLSERQWGTVR